MSTLERATEVYDSGHCPGCGLPFTQVSVEADYHDPEDGSPVGHEWGAARCSWSSDDLYTTQLIATGVVTIPTTKENTDGRDGHHEGPEGVLRAEGRAEAHGFRRGAEGADRRGEDRAGRAGGGRARGDARSEVALAAHTAKVMDLTSRTIAQLQEDEANDRMLRAEWDDRDGAA